MTPRLLAAAVLLTMLAPMPASADREDRGVARCIDRLVRAGMDPAKAAVTCEAMR